MHTGELSLRRLADIDIERQPLILKALKSLLHRQFVEAILDRPHHPGDLAVDLAEFASPFFIVFFAPAAQPRQQG